LSSENASGEFLFGEEFVFRGNLSSGSSSSEFVFGEESVFEEQFVCGECICGICLRLQVKK
jgi:hypothetical protein